MSIQLSVNVNKIATLRNSRGGNIPNILKFCKLALDLGAIGITVHPREDERHITKKDVLIIKNFIQNYNLQNNTSKEYNIEGEISNRFLEIILEAQPTQVTLVPVVPNEITSHQGFNLNQDEKELNKFIYSIKNSINSRVSIFVETDLDNLSYLKNIITDRVEFYTGPFAFAYDERKDIKIQESLQKYTKAAYLVSEMGLGINAGHDLDLDNLQLFKKLPNLLEVSIGHRLISYSLEVGFTRAIQDYLQILS